jgi:hypothetical protein
MLDYIRREVCRTGMVFPLSREEKCPREDCGSRHVERLGIDAGFAGFNLQSPARTLWLCVMCERPFKLVREPEVAASAARGRRGPVIPLERRADAVDAAKRRMA